MWLRKYIHVIYSDATDMQDYGLVSIITPSYNCERFIRQTIESIISQTYTNWELLVADDCSTDSTRSIVEDYAAVDKRIKLFKLDVNSGAGVARNEAIRHARGRYIAFCDSDDIWLRDKLAVQLQVMEKTGCPVAYASYITCDEDGRYNGIVVAYKEITYREILRDDSIGFLTCIYDVEKLGKVYLPDLRKRQDWGLKIRLLSKSRKAVGVIEPLAVYRLRGDSLSNKKLGLVKFNVRVYREVLNYNPVRAWLKFLFDFMPHYFAKKLRLRIINQ